MKLRTVKLILVLVAAGLLATSAGAADNENVTQFKALKCNMCHSLEKFEVEATITKAEMLGPDLSDVGSTRDAEWMKKWILQEVEIEGKTHKSKWKGTPKELEAVATWLATLKK